MPLSEQQQSELVGLLSSLYEQRLSGPDAARLQTLLDSDDAARKAYARFFVMCGLLQWRASERPTTSLGAAGQSSASEKTAAVSSAEAAGEAATPIAARERLLSRPARLSIAVAAAVVGLLLIGMYLVVPPFYRALVQRRAPEDSPSYEIVAQLTSVHEAAWPDGQVGTQLGAHLMAGHRMELREGIVEVAFRSGALIVVEGPASLTIDGAGEASLAHGKIVARVPQEARGFSVATRYGRIVDLGTEFAVDADPSGGADLYVIQGRVDVRSVGGERFEAQRTLTAGAAVKLRRAAESTVIEPIAYNVAGFARRSPTADSDWTADSPLPVGRALSLWLSADFGVVQDADGRAAMWKDRLTGDNRQAENAVQPEAARRPKPIADGIGGQPALVFDGHSTNMLTAPRSITGEHTVFLLAAPQPTDERIERQLLNTGAVPNYAFDLEADGAVTVRSYDGRNNAPQLTIKPPGGAPLLITFVHSRAAGESRLTVNGTTRRARAAPHVVDARGRLHVGSHIAFGKFFAGQMAELIVYDAALTDEEIAAVGHYLSEKYALAP